MYGRVSRSLTVHINREVVEMGSFLLLPIIHAIIPQASQCAIAVIRWKQTPVVIPAREPIFRCDF